LLSFSIHTSHSWKRFRSKLLLLPGTIHRTS
jgi:hypothetical protein